MHKDPESHAKLAQKREKSFTEIGPYWAFVIKCKYIKKKIVNSVVTEILLQNYTEPTICNSQSRTYMLSFL